MPTKIKQQPPVADLTEVQTNAPQAQSPQGRHKRQTRMDLGYMDIDTHHELPDGASPDLFDCRFENGGVRKDFGLENVGAAAPQRIADFARYGYIDPVGGNRVEKIARVYRNGGGNPAVEFLSAGVWGAPVAGTASMEDVLVHATTIKGILTFADGKTIHAFEEANVDITEQTLNFSNTHAGTVGTGTNGELIAVGEEHRTNGPLTSPAIGNNTTFWWRVEALSGLGFLEIAIEQFVSAVWLTIFTKTYLVAGPQVWPEEFQQFQQDLSAATDLRITIKAITASFGFTGPSVQVVGYGAVATQQEPHSGVEWFGQTAPATTWNTIGPPASYVFPFEKRLIALGGDDDPHRVAGSADDDPTEWRLLNEDRAKTGAFEYAATDIIDIGLEDVLCGGKVANNVAAVIRKRSILRLEETGQLEFPASLTDWIDGIGTEAPLSLAQTPDGIVFLGHDWMVYYLSGNSLVPLGEGIRQWLQEHLRRDSLPYIRGEYHDRFQEYWMLVDRDGGTGGDWWWIFDLGRYAATGEKVWRPKLVTGAVDCLPGPGAPPGGGSAPSPPESPPEIPPPPPPPPTLDLDNITPFENVYADGNVWIGGIQDDEPFAAVGYKIINCSSGLEVLQLRSDNPAHGFISNLFGYAAAYHPIRKEMWLYGDDTFDNPRIQVWDSVLLTLKAQYSYTTPYKTLAPNPHTIEYCPKTGHMYCAMRRNSGNDGTVVEIDETDGSILQWYKPLNTPGSFSAFDELHNHSMAWDPVNEVFLVAHLRDEMWTFDPVTGTTSALSCFVGGLIDVGSKVPEVYNIPGSDTFVIAYDRWVNLRTWDEIPSPGINSIACSNVTVRTNYGGGKQSPKFACVETFDHPDLGPVVAGSRGWNGLLFSDSNAYGFVDLYNKDMRFLRSWVIPHDVGRISYCPDINGIAVVSHWNQDTTWLVSFRSMEGVIAPDGVNSDPDGTPSNPDDGGGNKPLPAPDQPSTPTDPAPTPGGDPEPPGSTPGGAPVITNVSKFCTDGIGAGPPYSGTVTSGLKISWTDDAGEGGNPLDVRVWPKEADPNNLDNVGYLREWTGVSGNTNIEVGAFFTITVSGVSQADKPGCGFGERPDIDFYGWMRARHNGGTPGAWTNAIKVYIYNPEPPQNTGSEPAVGAPTFVDMRKGCVLSEDLPRPQSPTDWSGMVTVWGKGDARSGTNGQGIPVQFAEFTQGADPDIATPLRVITGYHSPTNPGQIVWDATFYIYNYRLNNANPAPSCTATVQPDITRDYYCRHIISDGNYSGWSIKRSLTYTYPGP